MVAGGWGLGTCGLRPYRFMGGPRLLPAWTVIYTRKTYVKRQIEEREHGARALNAESNYRWENAYIVRVLKRGSCNEQRAMFVWHHLKDKVQGPQTKRLQCVRTQSLSLSSHRYGVEGGQLAEISTEWKRGNRLKDIHDRFMMRWEELVLAMTRYIDKQS